MHCSWRRWRCYQPRSSVLGADRDEGMKAGERLSIGVCGAACVCLSVSRNLRDIAGTTVTTEMERCEW